MTTSDEKLNTIENLIGESLHWLNLLRKAYKELGQNEPSKLLDSISHLTEASELIVTVYDDLFEERISYMKESTLESLKTQMEILKNVKNCNSEQVENVINFIDKTFLK